MVDRGCREETPSPPKDPYPSPYDGGQEQCKGSSENKNSVCTVSTISPSKLPNGILNTDPAYGQARRTANIHHFWNETRAFDEEQPPADLVRRLMKEDENKLARADQISIRADTLRAAKRRLSFKSISEIFLLKYLFGSFLLRLYNYLFWFLMSHLRSWAQQESSVDETEHIRKILCEEQKKGRTHLVLDPHLEMILNHASHHQVICLLSTGYDFVEVS